MTGALDWSRGKDDGWKSFKPRLLEPVIRAVLAGNKGLARPGTMGLFGWKGRAASCSGLEKVSVGVGG